MAIRLFQRGHFLMIMTTVFPPAPIATVVIMGMRLF